MASPVADSYSAASGAPIYGGRSRYPTALLDQIAAAPENSWIQANANTFQSQWPGLDYTPTLGIAGTPAAIILAWSSFAWDDVGMRLVLFGGGHANYSGNDVYLWDAHTRQWKLGFYSSEVKIVGSSMEVIDGALHAPMSSHTYGNQWYLPILNRFVTLGGAAQPSGGPWSVYDAATGLTRVGRCYTLDLAQAGAGKVAGTTGSNVKRNSTVGLDLPGAQAWSLRDWMLDHPSAGIVPTSGINGFVCYRQENGHDTLYFAGSNGSGGGNSLTRIEFVDADYHNDIITVVGRPWDNISTDQCGALDLSTNVVVSPCGVGGYALEGWDLKTAAPANKNFRVSDADMTGPAASDFITQLSARDFGICYDEKRGYSVLWERGGAVYTLASPAGADPTTGWTVNRVSEPTSSPRPLTDAEMTDAARDTGVHGKWKRSQTLDVYIGLQHATDGNIWIFKPSGWSDPRI